MNKILIYSYWRTGSNLLTKLISETGNYYNLREFYTYVYNSWFTENNSIIDVPTNMVNDYLHLLSMAPNRVILKCMLPQITLIPENINNLYKFKILLHRFDIQQSIISSYIAQVRKSWVHMNAIKQPLFEDNIDLDILDTQINRVLSDYENFLIIANTVKYNLFVSYEHDLVPYIQNVKIDFYPSHNYFIKNIEQVNSHFHTNEYKKRIDNINKFFYQIHQHDKKDTLQNIIDQIKIGNKK